MAEVYKVIHPVKYFNNFISQNFRPDGRKFDDQRNIKLAVNTINTADASAIVKCGNTCVACGIKLELAKPKAEEPELGFLVTNVELLPLCSSKFRPGPPSDHAQVVSNIVSDIIVNSKCINLNNLCIVPDKLAWVVYCDMICLDYDGSVVDACMTAVMASLKTLTLPSVTYNFETEEITVDTSNRLPLEIHGLPVATSFCVYLQPPRSFVLADPTAYEEELCGGFGANLIVSWNKEHFCGIQRFGDCKLSTEDEKKILSIAKDRSVLVVKAVEASIHKVEK